MTSAIKTLLTLLALLAVVALLAGCGSTTPQKSSASEIGYLRTTDDSMTFIEWKQADGRVSGFIHKVSYKFGEESESDLSDFDGVLDGENFTLKLKRLFDSQDVPEAQPIKGELKDDHLKLFLRSGLQEYRRATMVDFVFAKIARKQRMSENRILGENLATTDRSTPNATTSPSPSKALESEQKYQNLGTPRDAIGAIRAHCQEFNKRLISQGKQPVSLLTCFKLLDESVKEEGAGR